MVGAAGVSGADDTRTFAIEHADDDAHPAFGSGNGLDVLVDDAVNFVVARQPGGVRTESDTADQKRGRTRHDPAWTLALARKVAVVGVSLLWVRL